VLEPRLAERLKLALNQPETTLTAKRPPEMTSAEAPSLANTPGCQRPGWIAAMTFSFSVASSSARLKPVDSCWCSAP
jgi:hypothetical protein